MVSKCAKLLLPVLALADGAAKVNVMVFGDSYGDTGPTFHQVQDMFDTRGVSASVKSAAIGGTAACYWAGQDGGKAMVTQANKLFPDLPDGPEFVWYTAGANDVWQDSTFQSCQKSANSYVALQKCMRTLMAKVTDCTATNLNNYFKAFPKSKIMQSGYDVPCQNVLCELTVDQAFNQHFCGSNTTCNNQVMYDLIDLYLGDMNTKFSAPQYTTLFMMGAIQKAEGVVGADVGKPVLGKGAKCEWETDCVHPSYNTPAGKAWGDAFWDLYFSQHLNSNVTLVV